METEAYQRQPYFDTPVGKFRILLNGEPTDFDVFYGEPTEFKSKNGNTIISANCFIAVFSTANLAPCDIVSGIMEKPVLYDSGCTAGVDSMHAT